MAEAMAKQWGEAMRKGERQTVLAGVREKHGDDQ